MGVAQTILDIVERAVADYPGAPVRNVRIAVGALAHIDDRAIRFAFDRLKEETRSSGAELLIERKTLTGHCRDCGRRFESELFETPCPGCDRFSIEWDGDMETHVISVDIDD